MPDKTPVTDGWGVAPAGHVSHFLRESKAICESVVSDMWSEPSYAYAGHCDRCERLLNEQG